MKVLCINNTRFEKHLTVGRKYEARHISDDQYWGITNDFGVTGSYWKEWFLEESPVEIWSPGDILKCDASDCDERLRFEQTYSVKLFIKGWDSKDGDCNKVLLNEVEGAFDPVNFRRITKFVGKQESSPRPFWLVKGGGGPANYEHTSLESAVSEARRLAMTRKGEIFTVLRPVRSYVTSELQMHDLSQYEEQPDNGIPF